MLRLVEIAGDRHLETLRNCGGFYDCPKDSQGRRLGPLVGYAGKYEGPNGKQLQWVGEVYANFAKAEVHPNVLRFFATCLSGRIYSQFRSIDVDVLCEAPIGGYALGTAIGIANDLQMIKAEKKITALATPTSREKSELVFGRHSVVAGQRYVIVEDVCNNFSTTEQLIQLIHSFGGEVIAIVCFLNRSTTIEDQFSSPILARSIPVISLVRRVIREWKQDDPEVAEDVASGNVVWKPKDDWDRLMRAMEENRE